MTNKWKVVAIIFIVLFVLETAFVIWAIGLGTDLTEREMECSNDICADGKYNAFAYDSSTRMCYCYTGNEITYEKYLK